MKKWYKNILSLMITVCLILSAASCQFNKVTDKEFTLSGLESDDIEGLYTGEWDLLNGKPNGEGQFTSDKVTYDGEWENGLPNGKGVLTTHTIDADTGTVKKTTNGHFKNGKPTGECEINVKTENGSIYKAKVNIEDDSFIGAVTLNFEIKNENETVIMDFSGKAEGGDGTLTITDSNGDTLTYTGQFSELSESSEPPSLSAGKLYAEKSDMILEYEGEFNNFAEHGNGKETIKSKTGEIMVKEGEFSFGNLYTGSLVMYDAKGEVTVRDTYKEGKQVFNYRDNDILSGIHDFITGVFQ